MRRYVAEFIGTLLFVTAIFGAVLTQPALAPLGIGAALIALVYAGGHLSGAHFNPAVSLAVAIRGRLAWVDFVPYVAAQLLGGLVAYFLSLGLYGDQLDRLPPGLDLDGMVVAVFLAELVFTFALVWVILNVATSRDHAGNGFYGLAIGLIVMSGAIAVGSVSSAAFNPAVVFTLNVAGVLQWQWSWLYLLAELLGATLAALAFRALNPEDR